MHKKVIAILLALSLCMSLSACTSKLTTIRPTLITRIAVEDIATGTKTEQRRKINPDLDVLMDDLVFLMERQYKQSGACADAVGHLYDVALYMGDQLELSVSIYSDGSVCKNGRRYELSIDADSDPVADLEKWNSFCSFDAGE